MQTIWQDIRYAIRQLRNAPGFAFTAIVILALGIGAVTSVFSVVDAVLLKPFAFPHPDRLVVLRETASAFKGEAYPANYKHYLNWKTNAKTIEDATIFENQRVSISRGLHAKPSGSDHPEIVGGLNISPNFFSVLGVPPMLGRSFSSSETVRGHEKVVILSWNAWQKYFQGDPAALGQTLGVGGEPMTVVGILPQSFSLPHMDEMATVVTQRTVLPYDVFQPLVMSDGRMSDDGDYDFLVIARLKVNRSLAQAESEIGGLQQAFFRTAHLPEHPWILVQPLKDAVAGGVSKALWLLLAAVSAVLLIACVNLANLQLARAVSRQREMAVRAALGAGRDRLAWSSLMESLIVAVIGGGVGLLLSFSGVRLFVSVAPASLPRLSDAHVSWPLMLIASALSIFTAVLFGLLPAWRAINVHPQAAMQGNTRVANTREGQRTRNVLVAGEVAFTAVLLVVAGLLTRSFSQLLTQQRDFNADHVTLAEVHLFDPQYADLQPSSQAVRFGFVERALAGLSQLPGVQSVAMTSQMPLTGETWINDIHRPDHPLPPGKEPNANMRWVSPEYASTLRIPILRGRDLNADDRDHPQNVLISEQTARSAWPDEDPIGKSFRSGLTDNYMVVGVVADARVNDLKKTVNMVYVPYWENPPWNLYFLVRSAEPASAMAQEIRQTLWKIDPSVPIPTVKALDDQVSDSVAAERFQMLVLTIFGIAALLLALLGVYGVLAYSVSLRQQEFGIRMALGSGRAALVRLVVRHASAPVLGGIFAGLALAFVAIRAIRSLLYAVSPFDPFVMSFVLLLLVSTSLIAALIPARRAASIDPMQALRTE